MTSKWLENFFKKSYHFYFGVSSKQKRSYFRNVQLKKDIRVNISNANANKSQMEQAKQMQNITLIQMFKRQFLESQR